MSSALTLFCNLSVENSIHIPFDELAFFKFSLHNSNVLRRNYDFFVVQFMQACCLVEFFLRGKLYDNFDVPFKNNRVCFAMCNKVAVVFS